MSFSRYRQLLLNEAYVDRTANRHLSMLRTLIRIAHRAGGITDKNEVERLLQIPRYTLQNSILSPDPPPAMSSDSKPRVKSLLTASQAYQLKHHHADTLQGWRDALLMCLLLDQGVAVTEIATLQRENFYLSKGLLRFRNPREGEEQMRRLSRDTLSATRAYFAADASLASGRLFRAIKKNGHLGKIVMNANHITARVHIIGKRILGIMTLRPHECHQYWAKSTHSSNFP